MLKSKWKHVKTREVYDLVGFCRREHDIAPCVIYRSELHPEEMFCRPVTEFFDGRFQLIPIPRATSGAW